MKHIKIPVDELRAKLLELLNDTQDTNMYSGWKKWILLDPETGDMVISNWVSPGTWTKEYEMLAGRETWKSENSIEVDELITFIFPNVISQLEEAKNCNRLDYELIYD